jgi:transposase
MRRSEAQHPWLPDNRIEITLPDGPCLRVGAAVDAAALRRVLAALRR